MITDPGYPTSPHSPLEIAQELELRRGDLSSFDYAHKAFSAWADIVDEQNSTPNNELPNAAIIDYTFHSTEYETAYSAARNGTTQVEIIPKRGLRSDSRRPISGTIADQNRGNRLVLQTEVKDDVISSRALAKKNLGAQVSYNDFNTLFGLVRTTHAAYIRIDNSLKGFRDNLIPGGDQTRIAPGKEDLFWKSKLIGTPNVPGLAYCEGFIDRRVPHINALSEQMYGENAKQALDLWWAIINMNAAIKLPAGKSTSDILAPMYEAMFDEDFDQASNLVKELLFAHPEMINARAKQRYELSEEERHDFLLRSLGKTGLTQPENDS